MNDLQEINKVFIISSGRTGTNFFGNNLEKIIPNSISVHEPDKVHFGLKNELFARIKKQGIWDLFILKALGIRGARNISLDYLSKKISKEKAINRFMESRKWINKSLYVESNAQLFGMCSTLLSMKNTKLAIIIRDPRDWVTSVTNHGCWYNHKDLMYKINLLGFKRLTPKNVGIKYNDWNNFNSFHKLCWVWNYMNTSFFNILDKQRVKYFFFEDIFIKKDKEIIQSFLQWVSGDLYKKEYEDIINDLLNKKVNASKEKKFPKWQNWDDTYCQHLHYQCGDLMKKLGYGQEEEWQRKINKNN